MIRFPHWLSTTAVAAIMFAQSLVLPIHATAPARAPARASDLAPARTAVTAPARAPALAPAPARAPDRATMPMQSEKTADTAVAKPVAKVETQRSGGGEPQAANAAPVASKHKLIVIDAGHGGSDPGAMHQTGDGQADVTEEDANLAIAQKLAEMLQADGYDVRLTRTGDVDIAPGGSEGADLQARVATANEAHADLLVSTHLNGAENREARGTEVWYCGDRQFGAQNEQLAKAVQESLVRNLREAGYDTKDMGVKDDAKMGHFAITGPNLDQPSNMPSIIGEPLYITNDQDAAQLKRPEMIEALARGYFEGIKAYFGEAH